jgi:putative ABC transport system permease protein
MFDRLIAYVRGLMHRDAVEGEAADELQFHVDRETEANVARGLSPAEARRAALRDLGGLTPTLEAVRDVRTVALDGLWQDVRYAGRQLRRAPVFSLLVIVSLGLGIGANTALFAVADGVLLQALPYRDPASLVMLTETQPQLNTRAPVSAPDFVDWSARSRTLERVAAYRPWGFVLATADGPERVMGARVSASLFPLLGVDPIAGRTFTADEDRFGGPHVLLLGEGLWRREFGASQSVLNTALTLDDTVYQVVGILPEALRLPAADLYVPLAFAPAELQQRGNRALTVLGRLKTGSTSAQTSAELSTIARDLQREYPASNADRGIGVMPLDDALVGSVRLTVWLVWAVVAIVMLIAGANAGNLLLARADGRRREIAVRFALGARASRVIRGLLAESVLLAVIAGAVGLGLAQVGVRAFVALAPATFPRLYNVRIDTVVFAVTVGVSLVSGLVFGLVPARRLSRPDADATLRERSVAGGHGGGLSHVAVAAQLALAVIVLIWSGLLVRSFETVLGVDLGFDARQAMTMSVSLPPKYDDPARRTLFFDQLLRRIDAAPGVLAAGMVSHLPLRGPRLVGDFSVEGRPRPAGSAESTAEYAVVSEAWFKALSIPVLAGRAFTDRDRTDSPPVAIINHAMARAFWPDANPIGQRMVMGATLGADLTPHTIVGLVEDIRTTSPEAAPQPTIYLPYRQNPWPTMSVVAKTAHTPDELATVFRASVRAIDPTQPVTGVLSFDDVVATSTAARRFQVSLISAFAVIALALTVLGTYGVTAYGVGLRVPEFGVRRAMGAAGHHILWLAIKRSMESAGIGIVAGLAIAGVVARALRSALFGVAPADPLTFVAVSSLTAAVVIAASALAGRRATGIDPVTALRRP